MNLRMTWTLVWKQKNQVWKLRKDYQGNWLDNFSGYSSMTERHEPFGFLYTGAMVRWFKKSSKETCLT